MSHKVVRPEVISILSEEGDTIPIEIAIRVLREHGYDASERALADIGYPPKRVRVNGHWQSVLEIGRRAA